jgi:hypothetical protein
MPGYRARALARLRPPLRLDYHIAMGLGGTDKLNKMRLRAQAEDLDLPQRPLAPSGVAGDRGRGAVAVSPRVA